MNENAKKKATTFNVKRIRRGRQQKRSMKNKIERGDGEKNAIIKS